MSYDYEDLDQAPPLCIGDRYYILDLVEELTALIHSLDTDHTERSFDDFYEQAQDVLESIRITLDE